jgi:hypothetical protein
MSWLLFRTAPKKREHIRGLLRAGAYFVAMGLVFGGLHIRSARAEVKDRTLELGRQMAQLASAKQHDVNKLSVNGQLIWMGSSLSDDTPSRILDRYQSTCEKDAAQPANAWRDLAQKTDGPADTRILSPGVLRAGDDREGSVVCFTKTDISKPTIAGAVKAFAETGNLGALGAARYAYAKKTDKGNTLVLTAWTDDTFNLLDLMAADGKDAPGADFPGIPRVPNATRGLSARLDETPFGVNIYRGKDDPKSVVAFYDDELGKAGWVALDPELEKGAAAPLAARLYEKDGVVLTVASRRDADAATLTALGLAGALAANEADRTP